MAVLIGMASIDENGKITGGRRGDQTGREILLRDWYLKNWNVFIVCKDKSIAQRAADLMRAICENDNFGYSQTARWTGYDSIIANNMNIGSAAGDFDCSSLVTACYAMAGVNFGSEFKSAFTGNMRRLFEATGLFDIYTDKGHCNNSQYAEVGAIYLNENSHVVMALSNGNKVNNPDSAGNNTTGGNDTVNIELPIIRMGSKGAAVATVQRLLNALGFRDQNGACLIVDGDAGNKTVYCIKRFQTARGLRDIDGIVGGDTWRALLQ